MIMTDYNITVYGIHFHLEFKDNLTLINGLSGVGKTMLFKQIENDALVNGANIMCFNYRSLTTNINISDILKNVSGKVIFIDNADALLSMEQRLNISMDTNNQYVIFAHNSRGFKPRRLSFTTLTVQGNKGFLTYDLL